MATGCLSDATPRLLICEGSTRAYADRERSFMPSSSADLQTRAMSLKMRKENSGLTRTIALPRTSRTSTARHSQAAADAPAS